MLQDEPEKLFVFGDNFGRVGFGGQAKEMRGELNAVGILTKRFPSMMPRAFLTNEDYDNWCIQSEADISRLMNHDGVIVWPEDGVGTGLAKLETHAPLIFNKIESLLRELNRWPK